MDSHLWKYFGKPSVSRKEYDELFLAMTRLTDRIEALEKSALSPFPELYSPHLPHD